MPRNNTVSVTTKLATSESTQTDDSPKRPDIAVLPTGRTSVAAVSEASDVEQRLILLHEPALRKKEGDRAATLRQISVGRCSASTVCAYSIQQLRRLDGFHSAAQETSRIARNDDINPCGRGTRDLQALFEITTAQGCCGLQFGATNR